MAAASKVEDQKLKTKVNICSICGKEFKKASSLSQHERIHSKEPQFSCNYCTKQFKEKGDLKKHERTHTGEKPYECKTCQKKFSDAGSLKGHEKIHEGKKRLNARPVDILLFKSPI